MHFYPAEFDTYSRRRSHAESPGFQIDLMYIRKDRTIVICECKYGQTLIGQSVVHEVNEKVERFISTQKKYNNYTIQTALITTSGVKNTVQVGFDVQFVLTLEDIFATPSNPPSPSVSHHYN